MQVRIERDEAGKPVRNPDQSVRTHVDFTDDPDIKSDDNPEGTHAVYLTGPISGLVALPDGTEYDVSDPVIKVPLAHVAALHKAIHQEHHARGRFLSVPVPTA